MCVRLFKKKKKFFSSPSQFKKKIKLDVYSVQFHNTELCCMLWSSKFFFCLISYCLVIRLVHIPCAGSNLDLVDLKSIPWHACFYCWEWFFIFYFFCMQQSLKFCVACQATDINDHFHESGRWKGLQMWKC